METSPPSVWKEPQSALKEATARPPMSLRRKNTIIAWWLVASTMTPVGSIAVLVGGAWLAWQHFAIDRAVRARPIRWASRQ